MQQTKNFINQHAFIACFFIIMLKQYEYWTREGKKWTSWFKTLSNEKHDYQFYDRRISSRLKNEYKDEESLCDGC